MLPVVSTNSGWTLRVLRTGASLCFSSETCAILESLLIQTATAVSTKVWLQIKSATHTEPSDCTRRLQPFCVAFFTKCATYLGLHLDYRLTWQTHIRTKRRQLDIKFRQMLWLPGRNSKLSLNNKLLLYKVVLKPIWSYGVQLWGCAKPARLKLIQRFQSKLLRTTVNAPWYVSSRLLHNYLHIPSTTEEIRRVVTKYSDKTHNHANDPIEHSCNNGPTDRRLCRTWPADLVQHWNDVPRGVTEDSLASHLRPLATHKLRGPTARRFRWTRPAALAQHWNSVP